MFNPVTLINRNTAAIDLTTNEVVLTDTSFNTGSFWTCDSRCIQIVAGSLTNRISVAVAVHLCIAALD